MKKFILFLNTLIMFELIALPAVPGLSSIFISKAYAETPESCAEKGLIYNGATNGCNVSNATAQGLGNIAKCEGHPNKEECYKQHAMDQMTKDAEADGALSANLKNKNGWASTAITGTAALGAIAIAIAGIEEQKKSTCSAISFWLMIGGAAALVGGDFVVNMIHDNKIRDIRKSWGEILTGEKEAKGDKDKLKIAGIEAQSAAFGKLAELEDRMAKTAKAKRILFDVAGGAFAGSAIAAGLEMIFPTKTSTFCTPGAKKVTNVKSGAEVINTETNAAGGNEITDPDKFSDFFNKTKNRPRYFEKINLLNLQTRSNIEFYNMASSKDIASLVMNYESRLRYFQSPSIDEYEEVKEVYSSLNLNKDQFELIKSVMITVMSNLNPLPSSYAKQESNSKKVYDYYEEKQVKASAYTLGSVALVGVLGGTLNVSKDFLESQRSWMTTPAARAGFSGVISTLSFVMAGQLKKSQRTAEARAEHLRKLEQSMLDSTNAMNICKSEDRNNQSKPHCYCYTPDNAPNPSRANSKVCQGLYAGNTELLPGEYNKLPGTSSTCIDNSYAPNPNCTCKQNNSCMKLNMAGLKLLNPGSFKVTGAAFAPVQDMANGTYDPAKISNAKLDQNAARLDALQKQIEKHPALKAYAKEKDKMQQGMASSLMGAARSLPATMASSGMRSLPASPAEAAKQLEDELSKPALSDESASGGAIAAQAPSSEGSLDFGISADDFATQEDQIAEVMNKDFEYGTNDINTGSATNIFEVLSNRYQRSGMRRLFDEQGLTQPEAPAKSDITQ